MIKRVIEQIFQDHAAESLRKTLAEVERAAGGKLHNESLADYVTRLASFKYDAEQRMAALADYRALMDEWHSVSLENGRESDELMGDYMVRIWTSLDVAQRFAEDQKEKLQAANKRIDYLLCEPADSVQTLRDLETTANDNGRKPDEAVREFMTRTVAELTHAQTAIRMIQNRAYIYNCKKDEPVIDFLSRMNGTLNDLRQRVRECDDAAEKNGCGRTEETAEFIARLAAERNEARKVLKAINDAANVLGRAEDESVSAFMSRISDLVVKEQRQADESRRELAALANERALEISRLTGVHAGDIARIDKLSAQLAEIEAEATECGRNEWEQVCGFMDRQFAELKELKQTITETNATIGKLHGTHADDIARIGTLSVELANETRRLRAYEDDYAQIYALSAAAGMQGSESVGQCLERKLAELSTVTADRDRIRAELAAILAEANKSGRCNGDPVQLLKAGQNDLDALNHCNRENARLSELSSKLQGELAEARDQAGTAQHECSIWNNAALRACQTLTKLGKLQDETEAQFIQRMQNAEFTREEQLKNALAAKNKAQSEDDESHRRFMNLIRMADSCGRLRGESVEQFVARQDQRRVSNMEQRDEARGEVARLSALVAELQVELDQAKGQYGGIMAQLGNETPLQLIERMKCLVKDRNRDLEEVDSLRKNLRLEIQDHADTRRQLTDASKTAFKHGLCNGEVVTDFIERKATELAGALQFGSRMQDMANERGDKLRAALATVENQSSAIAEAKQATEKYAAVVEAADKLKEWASTIRHKVLVPMVHTKAMAEYDAIMKELDGKAGTDGR